MRWMQIKLLEIIFVCMLSYLVAPRLGSLLPAPLILRPTPWSTLPLHPSMILVVAIHSPTPY